NTLLEAVKELESAGYRVENVRKVKRGHKITVRTGEKPVRTSDIEMLDRVFTKRGYILERPLFEEVTERRLHMFVHRKKRLGLF
uniref:hypothetical protein n=1 Tax=Thermofilum sp. TaxID=1961369 RepID=UPI0025906E92